jgi:uncharacterized protein (DUF433 family)
MDAMAEETSVAPDESGVTTTEHCYIIRKKGVLGEEPIIKGTRTPVRAIAELWRMGYRPEEIRSGLPHLSLAAVFDALSYFCDHTEEIMDHIKRNRVPEELIHPSVRHL